jgi:hypothetical protein
VFQAGLEGDPAAPGESRTPPGPLHPPSSPEMDDANSKRQATRWVSEQILYTLSQLVNRLNQWGRFWWLPLFDGVNA